MSDSTKKSRTAQDILQARIATIQAKRQQQPEYIEEVVQAPLSPKSNDNPHFFIIDVFDGSFKNDLASMEHPLFALKAGDTRTRVYEYNGNTVTVSPNIVGCATIHDKDVWIYCISALMAAINRGQPIYNTIRFTAYDFLIATNRETGGRNYKLLKECFDRLAGTRIITNIKTGGRLERENFGLLDRVKIIYEDENDENSPMIAVEVTLPEWLMRSIYAKQIKTISPDYFNIRSPIERRIYELCAKHCGKQASWSIEIKNLYAKSGSSANIREFRRTIKALIQRNDLPDYRLSYDAEKDLMKVKNRSIKGLKGLIKKI